MRFRLLGVPIIFAFATLLVWAIAVFGAEFSGRRRRGDLYSWRFPANVSELTKELELYKKENYGYLLTVFAAAYLYKQAFGIPGSFFLNLIAGALFGLWWGFLLACLLSTLGASICYCLSDVFGKQYVLDYFGTRVAYFQAKVEENEGRLFLFLLFARMFPISPSWLLNIIAPFIDVPLNLFVLSVFVGLGPYNFLCVQTGVLLSSLQRPEDFFDLGMMLKLTSVAALPLFLALFVKPKIERKNPHLTIVQHL